MSLVIECVFLEFAKKKYHADFAALKEVLEIFGGVDVLLSRKIDVTKEAFPEFKEDFNEKDARDLTESTECDLHLSLYKNTMGTCTSLKDISQMQLQLSDIGIDLII